MTSCPKCGEDAHGLHLCTVAWPTTQTAYYATKYTAIMVHGEEALTREWCRWPMAVTSYCRKYVLVIVDAAAYPRKQVPCLCGDPKCILTDFVA